MWDDGRGFSVGIEFEREMTCFMEKECWRRGRSGQVWWSVGGSTGISTGADHDDGGGGFMHVTCLSKLAISLGHHDRHLVKSRSIKHTQQITVLFPTRVSIFNA
jgi:hypothetical protein